MKKILIVVLSLVIAGLALKINSTPEPRLEKQETTIKLVEYGDLLCTDTEQPFCYELSREVTGKQCFHDKTNKVCFRRAYDYEIKDVP